MSWLKPAISMCLPIAEPARVRSVPSVFSWASYCAFVTGFGLLPHPVATSASTAARRATARVTAVGTLPATLQDTPSWGIEPAPERLRGRGTLDTTLLWTNLGISLLVLVLPAYFDLPLRTALAATLVGGLIGNGMLAVAALIGADARVPTMVLQRAPLGRRGSYLATALNILQCLGWAIFELIVIATAAGLLCDKLFGFKAIWFWKLVFGTLAAVLALLAWKGDETDQASADAYSGAVSTQNLFPEVPQRVRIVGASVLATAGALVVDMRSYQRFLLLLGAVFVPLLGVLLADWLLAGMHYTRAHVFDGPAFRLGPIVAWIAGFLVYEWLYQPADLGFWSRWLSHLPTPAYQFGASVPSFAVALLLTAGAVTLGSARAAARARREPLPGRR